MSIFFTPSILKTSNKHLRVCVGVLLFSLANHCVAENLAITGAKIHTVSSQGIIENGTVLIENGKIKEVLDAVSVPVGYTEFDASGKIITPGFIAALTNIGLVEVSLSAGVNDSRIEASPVSNVGAAYDAQYAINTDSTIIDITRLEGFTSAATGVSRTGQLFGGLGAVIDLSKQFDSVRKSHAFMSVDVGSGGAHSAGDSRAALWVTLNQSLQEAVFASNYDLSPSEAWEGMISRADAKALIPLVKGQLPLLVTANRANDILQALAIKERFSDINLVLVEASDAWRVADHIAAANVPVILNPENNLPGQFDTLGATLANAARLHAAGVEVSIGIDTHNVRLAPQHAGNAVANGLPHDAAIKALTINPAKIYGIDEELGSIEVGKQADLVIWSGDPLEVTQAAEQVFIAGKAMSMESRQTLLRDRYLHRDVSKPVAYSK